MFNILACLSSLGAWLLPKQQPQMHKVMIQSSEWQYFWFSEMIKPGNASKQIAKFFYHTGYKKVYWNYFIYTSKGHVTKVQVIQKLTLLLSLIIMIWLIYFCAFFSFIMYNNLCYKFMCFKCTGIALIYKIPHRMFTRLQQKPNTQLPWIQMLSLQEGTYSITMDAVIWLPCNW